jgi:hypothetical protein
MELAEKFYTGDLASGFDEFINLPLQLSQTFGCFEPGRLSEALSRAHCKGVTGLNPMGGLYIAVFAKNLGSKREALTSGNFPSALLAFNHFSLGH